VGYDSAVPGGLVGEALRARPYVGIVSVVHRETPCGTVNDVGAAVGAALGEDPPLRIGFTRIAAGQRNPERESPQRWWDDIRAMRK